MSVGLSVTYGAMFERLLAAVAAAADPDSWLVPFWPLRGAAYDGELLVIGRSVNGWVEDWTARQLADPAQRQIAVDAMRRDAEPVAGDRMSWVADLWGVSRGYNTRRSAFWRVLSQLGPGGPTDGWPGQLAWTNLYKVSPAAGWNPGTDLRRAQRQAAIELLKREVEEFAPRRVLALTGGWISPFTPGLGLTVHARPGLVEGVGVRDGCAWVVAKHPMGKPEGRFVSEVVAAFAELGAPL